MENPICVFAIVSQKAVVFCFMHQQWLIKLCLEPELSQNNTNKTSSCRADMIYGTDTTFNCVCYIVTFTFYERFAIISVCLSQTLQYFPFRSLQKKLGEKQWNGISNLAGLAGYGGKGFWKCIKILLGNPFCICGFPNRNKCSETQWSSVVALGWSVLLVEQRELIKAHDSAVMPFITVSCYEIHYLPFTTLSMTEWESEVRRGWEDVQWEWFWWKVLETASCTVAAILRTTAVR